MDRACSQCAIGQLCKRTVNQRWERYGHSLPFLDMERDLVAKKPKGIYEVLMYSLATAHHLYTVGNRKALELGGDFR
jgi:hypothetical protein